MLLDAAGVDTSVAQLRLHTGLHRVVTRLGIATERGVQLLVLRCEDGSVAIARPQSQAAAGREKLLHHRELVDYAVLQVRDSCRMRYRRWLLQVDTQASAKRTRSRRLA